MKTICIALIALLTAFTAPTNKPIEKIDLKRFGGKWYSLYSIPTMFDKGTYETTVTYTLNKDGYYNCFTMAKKDDNQWHTYNSKLFPDKAANGEMEAQFLWPFKVDYWVIDLPEDYSYVVVGHPDHKFLFIMSRKPTMDKQLHDELVEKCKEMGYPVNELTSQKHTATE
jgi:apolipoprotein D and lipocalin family protein